MNHSEEETTKSIAIIAIIAVVVVVVFSSYNIVSAYAVIAHQLRFCFTTTATVGVTGVAPRVWVSANKLRTCMPVRVILSHSIAPRRVAFQYNRTIEITTTATTVEIVPKFVGHFTLRQRVEGRRLDINKEYNEVYRLSFLIYFTLETLEIK